MTSWLLETLVWTAALIAAVLVLRRPVARWFGPHVAYALWAIPALRLVLPPIALPAWMRPVEAAPQAGDAAKVAVFDPANLLAAANGEGAGTIAGASPATAEVSSFDYATLLQLGLVVWLTGADQGLLTLHKV